MNSETFVVSLFPSRIFENLLGNSCNFFIMWICHVKIPELTMKNMKNRWRKVKLHLLTRTADSWFLTAHLLVPIFILVYFSFLTFPVATSMLVIALCIMTSSVTGQRCTYDLHCMGRMICNSDGYCQQLVSGNNTTFFRAKHKPFGCFSFSRLYYLA